MLSFAGCDDNHIALHDDQWHKYAEIKYNECTKDSVYIAEGKNAGCTEEAVFAEKGHKEPLAKEGTTNPLPRMVTGLGAMMSLFPQVHLPRMLCKATMNTLPQWDMAMYAMQGNNKPLAILGNWASTFDYHEGAKVLAINLIEPIAIPYHCDKASEHLQ
jgi:hypothetical protein